MTWKRMLVVLALLALAPLAATDTLAKKGGNKPPPEPTQPADPAIVCIVDWLSTEAKVVVMDADGGNRTVVHTTVGPIIEPTWAPDGSAVAFLKGFKELWRIDVAVVDGVPEGSDPQLILAELDYNQIRKPQWSPEGDEIFYMAQGDDSYELRAVSAGGGTPRVVYDPPSRGIGRPTFSPDGSRIAFTTGAGSPKDIQVLDLATGVVTTVLSDWTDGFKDLDWSHTDDVLAFIDSDEGPDRDHQRGGRLYTIDLDTRELTYHLEGAEELTWLPDVTQIVFLGVNYKKWKLGGLRTYDPATEAMEKIADDVRWPDGLR